MTPYVVNIPSIFDWQSLGMALLVLLAGALAAIAAVVLAVYVGQRVLRWMHGAAWGVVEEQTRPVGRVGRNVGWLAGVGRLFR